MIIRYLNSNYYGGKTQNQLAAQKYISCTFLVT